MPYGDFEVETLARYLHLTPQQVIKLAERGNLPGRKVGGEWKFAKPDIHLWFEQRIGLSGEEELLKVEHMLQHSAPEEDREHVRIAELLPVEAIAIPPLRADAEFGDRVNGPNWPPTRACSGILRRWPRRCGGAKTCTPRRSKMGVALLHPRRPLPKILAQPVFGARLHGDRHPLRRRFVAD